MINLILRKFAVALLLIAAVARADVQGPRDNDGRIAKLIQWLGSADYSLRQQAREELKQMGCQAFDRLLQAQYDQLA